MPAVFIILAKAGIQGEAELDFAIGVRGEMDPGLRRDDGRWGMR
jgi:hypothetical protein